MTVAWRAFLPWNMGSELVLNPVLRPRGHRNKDCLSIDMFHDMFHDIFVEFLLADGAAQNVNKSPFTGVFVF
jgi:hypothetical protein